jgi:hypothetical protein
MDCKNVAQTLARLADGLPSYGAELRQSGFECCHVNDDWIERNCGAADVTTHKRYLIEFAREVLATGKPSPGAGDWRGRLRCAACCRTCCKRCVPQLQR